MPRRTLCPALAAALFATSAVGCNDRSASYTVRPTAAPAPGAAQQKPPDAAPDADGKPEPGGKPGQAADIPAERKIIFNGSLSVVVKDFDTARAEATRLVEQAKGYFAKTDVTGDAGTRRSGTFTVKVPAERFQATVDAFARLGVAVKNSTDSQDVTEEFVDVSARVKNLKAEEETYNRLLKDVAGRLDDVFKIREQVRQVRGEIEKAEGRLKVLSSLTALSTIVLTLREESEFVPPTVVPPPAPPTFPERVAVTFGESVGVLQQLAEGAALTVVALAPWLLVVVPAAAVAHWSVRRRLPAPRPKPVVARRVTAAPLSDEPPTDAGGPDR